MLKIKTRIICNFITKVRMNGKQKISECIFDFAEDGLHISGINETNLSMVDSFLDKKAFAEYSAIGKIALNDLDNVEHVLARFDDIITMDKSGNLVTIKGEGKKVDIEMINEDYIKKVAMPPLTFDQTAKISSVALKNVFKDAQISSDAKIIIETGQDKLIFSNTGKYKFMTEVISEGVRPGVKASFGEPMIEALEKLDGTLEMNMKTDYPMKVVETAENSTITIICAPRVED